MFFVRASETTSKATVVLFLGLRKIRGSLAKRPAGVLPAPPRPAPRRPALPRPTALQCDARARSARGMLGFWIKQIEIGQKLHNVVPHVSQGDSAFLRET